MIKLVLQSKEWHLICPEYRCEPFSTYPRTYDLLHANHLFSHYKNRGEGCLLEDILLEMDRIIRPQVITSIGAISYACFYWSIKNISYGILRTKKEEQFFSRMARQYNYFCILRFYSKFHHHYPHLYPMHMESDINSHLLLFIICILILLLNIRSDLFE